MHRRLRRTIVAAVVAVAGLMAMTLPASATAPIRVSSAAWLGGQGVNVCAPSTDPYCGTEYHVGGIAANWWQCVELAQRLYKARGWHTGIFAGVNYAYQIYDQAANLGMLRQANGAITSLAPGDMIIHGTDTGSGAGHVSIVNSVSGGTVSAVEQNASTTGWATYSFNGSTLSRPGTGTIRGVVHDPGNTSGGSTVRKIVNTDFNRDGKPDIYAINRNEGGTTVRIINGTNMYQWLLQDGTVLGATGPETDFAVDDYNGDGIPDIYAIQRNDTGSNSTAVRIINGANRQQWLLQSGTLLSQTGPETSFAVADYNQDGVPDIYAINRNDAGSGQTAVRIINGANLNQWLLQSPTVLGATDDNTEFAVGFYDGDNTPDIYAIQRNDPGSGSTAVRVINGANVYQWLLQTGTILGQTTSNWDFRVADFNNDGKSDLYAFNRNDTGSNSTAVHVVNGNGFNSWLLQSGTLLGPTTAQWSFR